MNNVSHIWKQKHTLLFDNEFEFSKKRQPLKFTLLFANEFERYMKHSFNVFDHALKTFERDKRLSFRCFFTHPSRSNTGTFDIYIT